MPQSPGNNGSLRTPQPGTHFRFAENPMRLVRPLFLLILVAGSLFAPTFAAEPSFEESATQRLRDATSGDTSGAAVLVARDGKIVFQGGFGFADIEKKSPITPETKFRIGSISKQFTAAAVLRLAEQGKLSLDDTLDK